MLIDIFESELKIEVIKNKLFELFPNPKSELIFKNNFELLIAVVLSAQCTDKRVNLITPNLFKLFPNSKEMAKTETYEIEKLLASCNLYKNKSKYIIELSKQLENNFNGTVPLNQKDLMSLSGVGQKTANVVMLESIGANLMAVDTHVFRVAHRLGLTNSKTPEKVERDLTTIFKKDLGKLHGAFVLFGRYFCTAKEPKCNNCILINECKYLN